MFGRGVLGAAGLSGCIAGVTSISLAAQVPSELRSGVRVRLALNTLPAQTLVGKVAAVRGDTLQVRIQRLRGRDVYGETEPYPIAFATISTLEVSRGSHGHTLLGAFAGATLLGVVVGLTTRDDPPCPANDFSCSYKMSQEDKILLGAGLGAGIGALVGTTIRSERWQPVVLERPGARPVSLVGVGVFRGVGVGVSVSF